MLAQSKDDSAVELHFQCRFRNIHSRTERIDTAPFSMQQHVRTEERRFRTVCTIQFFPSFRTIDALGLSLRSIVPIAEFEGRSTTAVPRWDL